MPVAERRGLRRTAAIGPIRDGDETAAWLYLRVTPRTARFPTETPFPRVLAPTGLFGLDDEALGYAEYDDGVLVRQRGPAPLRIDSTVYAALSDRARAYRRPEMLDGRPTLAYYERQGDDAQDVVAVRAPAADRLDALFVLLRLSLSGLAAGAASCSSSASTSGGGPGCCPSRGPGSATRCSTGSWSSAWRAWR